MVEELALLFISIQAHIFLNLDSMTENVEPKFGVYRTGTD